MFSKISELSEPSGCRTFNVTCDFWNCRVFTVEHIAAVARADFVQVDGVQIIYGLREAQIVAEHETQDRKSDLARAIEINAGRLQVDLVIGLPAAPWKVRVGEQQRMSCRRMRRAIAHPFDPTSSGLASKLASVTGVALAVRRRGAM
jgi:hypothetical protein